MTLYRARVLDTPNNPFTCGELRADDDAGILVREGQILARAGYEQVRADYADEDAVDLRDGVLLPGLVDTHVHFPQVRIIGGLGVPLLQWLDDCALPEGPAWPTPATPVRSPPTWSVGQRRARPRQDLHLAQEADIGAVWIAGTSPRRPRQLNSPDPAPASR